MKSNHKTGLSHCDFTGKRQFVITLIATRKENTIQSGLEQAADFHEDVMFIL
jgi:hypothetical protein